ncbi:MAG: type I restriction enzyme HsdR N-terminal domain-containing protein [Bacteroidales bacterium]
MEHDNSDDSMLPLLDFPPFNFTIREIYGKKEIFDFIRKKYVALTPEEWVRQNTLHFLHHNLKVPAGLMVVEKTLSLNTLSKRADILVYDKNAKPCMLVECKAPGVKINQDVFEQIARYNLVFKVKYLFVTNGTQHFAFEVNFFTQKVMNLQYFPDWNEMNHQKEE